MKFLVLAFAIIGLIAVLFGVVLYAEVKISNIPITLEIAKVAPTSTTATTTTNPIVVPQSSFHGPTAQPHINGPTANPPNY